MGGEKCSKMEFNLSPPLLLPLTLHLGTEEYSKSMRVKKCFVGDAKYCRAPWLGNEIFFLLKFPEILKNHISLWKNRRWHHPILSGALSGLRQVLATESSLKMMKNSFYFTLKALFAFKIFKFLTLWTCRKTAWLER